MSKITTKNIVNFIGWLSVILIAVAIVIGKIFPSINGVCMSIVTALSFFVAVIVGFYYAFSKRNRIYLVVFILAVVVAVIMYFI